MKQKSKFGLAIFLSSCLSALLAVGLVIGYQHYSNGKLELVTEQQSSEAHGFKDNVHTVALGGNVPENFTYAAERSIHGVVNVRCESKRNAYSGGRQFIDPFELFFGQRGFGGQAPEPQMAINIGSGVIISSDGYIITNNHVISGADKVTVSLHNNKEYEATIVGSDPATDIALLKVDAENLPVIPFGDSEQLRVGEWVLAVGNPFNLSSTVTAGIVSAKGRSAMSGDKLEIASFIQTDAAVNQGNSGGALVNTKGELVGINTMIYSSNGSYAGYSFAVPVSIASKVVSDIKQYGNVQRAVLGVVGSNINSELAEKHNLKITEGAFIADFAPISAAKQAGIMKEDVITAVQDVPIRNMAELQEQISKYRPGDKIKVGVNRKGKSLSFKVELKNKRGNTDIVQDAGYSSLGAAFKSISAEKMRKYGLNYGVEIVGLDDGKLKRAGLSKGCIILSVNNISVRSPKEIEQIVEQISSSPTADKALFIKVIMPNGKLKYIAVDLA